MKILEVKNLSKKYEENEVIKNISFDVNEGETLVILGASGSGKSTLLRCINNLEKITNGNIIINGNKIVKEYKNSLPIYNDKEILKKINLETGMIFQDFNLFRHLSVKENIIKSLTCVLKKNRNDAEKIAENLLDQMNLLNKKDEYPCNLSGGQKQRASIARCLALNPKIICMDEPTSALDPELVGEVLKVIKTLAKEKRTMIIVTHEIKFAEEVADRVIFMDSGKIVEEGNPKELIRNPKKYRTKQFLKRYISFEDELENIKPQKVITYFKQISNIPRESGNEEKIKDYLIEFAKERNLEYFSDENYNVIIRNCADENKEFLSFQAHTDMICEKNEKSKHDFSEDPIKIIKEGDFIKADGTTLGADNGIGVSIMLGLLDKKEYKKYNIECIFTVQEETTMIGAKKIDANQIKSRKIISLDNSKENQMIISSANCMEWFGKIEKEYEKNDYKNTYKIEYSNFKGGHSGNDIKDSTRFNPIKYGIELISDFEDIRINNIKGGSRVNVIPRDFELVISAKNDIYENLLEKINEQKSLFEKNGKVIIKKISQKEMCLKKDIGNKIINFIKNYQNGPLEYENKKVILSANMGAIKEFDDYIRIEYSLRSNNKDLKEKYLANLDLIQKQNNINIIWNQELDGFEPDYNSELVKKTAKIYEEVFNKSIEKVITQGVLEGGILKNRIQNLEYICIGTNIYDAHSPKERVSIKSIKNTWKFVNKIIEIGLQ